MARLSASPHTRPRRPGPRPACCLLHDPDADGSSCCGGVDHLAALGYLHPPGRYESSGCASSGLHQFTPGIVLARSVVRAVARGVSRDGPGSFGGADGALRRATGQQLQDRFLELAINIGHPVSATGGRTEGDLIPVALPLFTPLDPATTRRADLLCRLRCGGSRHTAESCTAQPRCPGWGARQNPRCTPIVSVTYTTYTRSSVVIGGAAVTKGLQ